MIYILTIIIFFIGFFLCNIKNKSFSDCKSKFLKKLLEFLAEEKYNGYFINIIIAILGVTCAILLTNYDTKKREINQTIELLNYLSCELIAEEEYVYQNISEIKKDYEDELTAEIIKCIEFSPTVVIDNLLTVSPYQSTISNVCYNALYECKKNINTLENGIKDTNDLRDIEGLLTTIYYELEYMKVVVDFEVIYQNGGIEYEELYNKINEFNNVYNKDIFQGESSVIYYFELQ